MNRVAARSSFSVHLTPDQPTREQPHPAQQRPDWVIQAGTKHAEQIINEGKAKYYDIAVRRLALVRRAYQHAGRAEDWRRYEAQLRDTHGRKRKLMDMLRQIGK